MAGLTDGLRFARARKKGWARGPTPSLDLEESGCIAVADQAVAMHPLAVRTATAASIRVEPGVVALRFGLAGLAVHDDVIHLHVAIATVVGVRDRDAAAQAGRGSVVLHAGGEVPARDRLVVDSQLDVLAADRTARTHREALAAATAAAAGAAAAARRGGTAASFGHRDVGAATALVTLGGHDLVVVLAEVHA